LELRIQTRIEDRSRAKLDRDFDKADDIRDELRFKHNIVIDDNSKLYNKIDPNANDEGYSFGGKRMENVPEDQLLAIQKFISQRVQAKKKRDYDTADSILKKLELDYGVSVNDKKKRWHFAGTKRRATTDRNNQDPEDPSSSLERNKTPPPKMTREAAQNLSVKDIRSILRENGLTIAGTKDKLIKRLVTKGIVKKKKVKSQEVKDKEGNNAPFFLDENSGTDSSDSNVEPAITEDSNDKMFFVADSVPDGVSIVEETNNDVINAGEISNDSLPDFNDLTVKELKDKLRAAGLAVRGNKAELIERLTHPTQPMKNLEDEVIAVTDDEVIAVTEDEVIVSEEDLSEVSSSTSNDNAREKLEGLTVPQLKEMLRDASLPVGGRKAELIDRLEATK